MDPRDNIPWLYRFPVMRHYYGDMVRQLFLSAAVIMLVGAPFYTDDIGAQGPVLVVAAIMLAVIAGVMSPQMRFAKIAGTVVAGLGAIFFELWALAEYQSTQDFSAFFVIRQVLALLFFFALYFSIKSTRADVLEHLGDGDEDSDDRTMSDLVAEAESGFVADAGDSHVHAEPGDRP